MPSDLKTIRAVSKAPMALTCLFKSFSNQKVFSVNTLLTFAEITIYIE
jgi:hypothetical protein